MLYAKLNGRYCFASRITKSILDVIIKFYKFFAVPKFCPNLLILSRIGSPRRQNSLQERTTHQRIDSGVGREGS